MPTATPSAIEPLLVPATVPPTPLVLCEEVFLRELAFFEDRCRSISIASPQGAQQAADMLRDLTTAGSKLEKARKDLKDPFLKIGRQIDETAKAPAGRIDRLKLKLRGELARWQEIEAARVREEERKRQAELARLEEEKQRREEEAKRQAEAVSASAGDVDLDFEDLDFADEPAPKSEIDRQIEAVKFAPAVKTEAPSGVRTVIRLVFIVQDVAKLPEQFVIRTPNERLLRETFVHGWKDGDTLPSVPGCVFSVQRDVVSTGRSNQPEF